MIEGDTSKHFERGITSREPPALSPSYTSTNSVSWSRSVWHRTTCAALDEGTIQVGLIEPPWLNSLDVVLRVRRIEWFDAERLGGCDEATDLTEFAENAPRGVKSAGKQ